MEEQQQQQQLAEIMGPDPTAFEVLVSYLMATANDPRSQAEELRTLIPLRTVLRDAHRAARGTSRDMVGRGQISRNLKELRFLYCQTSPASAATREFVQRNYKDLKTLNPKFPFLIRECSIAQPQLWARYDMGVERFVRLDGLTEAQITKKLEELVKAGAAV